MNMNNNVSDLISTLKDIDTVILASAEDGGVQLLKENALHKSKSLNEVIGILEMLIYFDHVLGSNKPKGK